MHEALQLLFGPEKSLHHIERKYADECKAEK